MEHRCRRFDEENPRPGAHSRLREGMASGGLLHYGQGKWYPGEAVPRWALSCYWRVDGIPVWEDIGLIAREDREYSFRAADALGFIEALTRRLQVSSENLLPAYNPDSETTEPAGYILPLRRRQPEGQLRWSSQLWFPRPGAPGPVGWRFTHRLPHSHRVHAVGCA